VPPSVRFLASNASNLLSTGDSPYTAFGVLQCSPNSLAVFKEPTSKGIRGRREGKER